MRHSAHTTAALALWLGTALAGLAPAAIAEVAEPAAKPTAQVEVQMQAPASDGPQETPVPKAAIRQPVVVEMYTSQGCAACPPAEAWLGRVAQHDDVIALALHVDYWDYLGWADSFANPEFTTRQKNYARHVGERMIYTPQVIINGAARLEGSHTALLDAHINALRSSEPKASVSLNLSRVGETLWIEAEANPPLTRPVMVQLVRYLPQAEALIARGENAGLNARHHNIVTSWSLLAEWSGRDPLRVDAHAEGEDPLVVILQEPGPGAVIAAARLR